MKLNLESLFNNEGQSISIDHTLVFGDVNDLPGTVSGDAEVRGEIKNTAGIVTFKARVTFNLLTVCDRCAKDITLPVDMSFEHILVVSLNEEDNDDFILIDASCFDCDELIRDDVILELPPKILCSDDCKGLCPKCGKDLNEGNCDCKKDIDPRLEILKQLIDND